MKKSRIGLFVLSLISCLSILLTSAVQVNAVTEYDSAWKPAIYAYNGFNNRLASGTIGYSDKILMIDARMEEPDPSIAKVSAALAAGAYRPTDEFNDNDDVNDTLKGMGYTILRNVNYDRQSSYLDNDFVAFTIASRQIQINGEDYVVYCIPVRGTDGREWYSDFNLGDTGNHEGFYTAAQEIFQVLEGIMNNDAYDTEHRILWITGHSRGAAVANIVEGEMTANADYALPEHIFGYNFACPSISRNESVTGTDFHNIFNFNNIGDLIPLLPMAEWGYTAYGQNLYLDVSQIDNVKFQIKNNSDRDYYAPMTPEGYLMSLNLIAAAEDSFHDKEMDIALFILAAYLGGDLNVNEGPLGLGRFLKTCFEKLGKDLNGDAMGTLLAIADFFVTTNSSVAAVAGLVAFLEESLKTLNGYRMEDNWEELISRWFAVTSNSEKLAEVSQYLMFYGIGTITTVSGVSLAYDQLRAVVDKYEKTAERIAGIMGLFYSTDGKLLEAFEYGHHPETYVTWINSMYLGYKGWNEYTDEIPVFKNIKSIDAYCFANVQKDVNPAFFNEDPSQIGYFGEMALYNNKITELTLYKETDYAGAKAFGDNKLLEKVTLPVDSLVTNTRAFSGCENIETLIYTPGETGIMPEQLDYYEEGKLLTDYRIESIAHNALKTLIYEEGVKELSARAGYGSYNAYGNGERLVAVGCERIDLPDSLEKIGDYAFDRISPEEFHLGPNLKEIGSYAFRFSKSRFTGSLDNLETVGDKAFYKTSIASDVLKLPGKVKKIGKNAFEGCTKLTGTIEILADQEFGDGAFYGCTGFRKLVLPVDFVYPRLSTGIHSYSSGEEWDGGTIFGECAIEEIEYKPGVTGIMTKIESSTSTYEDRNSSSHRAESTCRESLKRIIYDEGITEIAAYACYDNRYSPTSYTLTLDEIHLPSTLQKVGAYAFYNTGLTEVYLPKAITEVGTNAFNSNPNLTLYVYRNTAAHNYAVNNKIPYVFMDPAATAILLPAEKEVMLGSTEQLNVTYTPEDATDPIFWVSSDESVVSIDENGNAKALSTGTAVITATTESGLTTQSVITVTSKGVCVYGSSLALEGKIGINFYLNIAEEELEYLNVAMTMNGQRMTVPASEGKASTVSGQKLRMFAYPVAAKEMRDKVTLTVEDADGNKVKLTKDETDYTEGYPYSASDYFARAEEAGSEKTKKLARVLNNYGKYTQIYFDYHVTDDVLNTKDVSAVTLETLKPYQAVQTSTEVAGLTYVGGSTMLDDMIGYRLYFKIDASHQISDYTFTMDGEEVTPVKSGSQYYIEKTDIAARDLGNKNTIEVTDGTTTFGIQYCALSYAYRALELTGENRIPLQNMCRAMYLYNQQAIEYFNS